MSRLIFTLAALVALTFSTSHAYAQGKPNNPDNPNLEEPAPPPAPPEPEEPDPPKPEPISDIVTAQDAKSVVAALEGMGLTVEVGKTSAGRTKLSFRYQDASSSLYLFDCHDGMGDCDSIRFLHGLNFPDGVTLQAADDWNSQELWGRAFLDGNSDPWLDTMMWVGEGVSKAQFAEVFAKWTKAVTLFRAHFEKS